MTKEEFELVETDLIFMIRANGDILSRRDIVDKLNELSKENHCLCEENTKLKKGLATCERKLGKVFEFIDIVFESIDKDVAELEARYKFGKEVYKGCPMHNIVFGINSLLALKRRILKEIGCEDGDISLFSNKER